MSAHQRRRDSTDCSARSLDRASVDAGAPAVDPPALPHQPQVATRLEREFLYARIRSLERELAASEHQRQVVIDQYERLLAECEADRSASDDADPAPRIDGLRTAVDAVRSRLP